MRRTLLAALTAAAWAATAPTVTVFTANTSNHAVSKKWMGCHFDPGYVNQPRGWTSNMIYGSGFTDGTNVASVPSWNTAMGYNASGSVVMCPTTVFNSRPTLQFEVDEGPADRLNAWASNRGLGNEGLFLEPGQEYEGFAYIAPQEQVTVFFGLRDFTTNQWLATQEVTLEPAYPWSTLWTKVNFTLQLGDVGTECVGIAPGSDPSIDCVDNGLPTSAHVCVRCGGEFVIGIVGTSVPTSVGWVELHPGDWGRFAGLPVLASAVENARAMGVTTIRQGGTVSQAIRWKDWRGEPAYRASSTQTWQSSLIGGWGPFEIIDVANAAGFEPIVTLADDVNSATDFADFVEYCWGNENTYWGSIRITEDGHPQPYNLTTIELGNEQYNLDFVEQIAAMEARAKAVGAPPFRYMFPTNGYSGVDAADATKAVAAGLPIERILVDLHEGAGGAVGHATALFANPPIPGFNQGAINCETNGKTHDLQRALEEAQDLLAFFTAPSAVSSRIYARTASFCSERSGHFDNYDQGLSFFLPNMTWLQPPGWVHTMITQTWADIVLVANYSALPPGVSFAAQLTADRATFVVRAVNMGAAVQPLVVELAGGAFSLEVNANSAVTALTGPDLQGDNPPSAPLTISPAAILSADVSENSVMLELPPYSFVVATFPAHH